jgi:hypothetical protein
LFINGPGTGWRWARFAGPIVFRRFFPSPHNRNRPWSRCSNAPAPISRRPTRPRGRSGRDRRAARGRPGCHRSQEELEEARIAALAADDDAVAKIERKQAIAKREEERAAAKIPLVRARLSIVREASRERLFNQTFADDFRPKVKRYTELATETLAAAKVLAAALNRLARFTTPAPCAFCTTRRSPQPARSCCRRPRSRPPRACPRRWSKRGCCGAS